MRLPALIACLGAMFACTSHAQDRIVPFNTNDAGLTTKSVTTWGMGTIGGYNVMQSGIINMGADEIDVVIMPFALEGNFVNGSFTGLTDGAKGLLNDGMLTAQLAGATKPVILSAGNGPAAEYITGPNRVHRDRWAATMVATKQHVVTNFPNQPVAWMSPFNEPDYGPWNMGNGDDLSDIIWQLKFGPYASQFGGTQLGGGAVLNVDTAKGWYDRIAWLDPIGTTHAISGSVDGYVNFLNATTANGDTAFCPELHCLGEAIIGAEYGMDGGIYWLRTDRARGAFAKTCQGTRLGYAEHRPNWTAAAVYKKNGLVQAFVGGNERMGAETSYRFFSKDRDVFYNGEGPRRDFTLNGAPTREQVMNITWGPDVPQPVTGRFVIVSRNSGKVMEVAGASTADNGNIQQNTYNGGLHQQWDIASYYPGHGDHSYFKISAAHSGKIADMANHSYNDGANVAQWGDAGDFYNQHWFFGYIADGYFYIRNRWSGKYLDVNGVSTADGANIHQWTGTGGLNQQWRLIPVGATPPALTAPADVTAPTTPTGFGATANAAAVTLTWNANSQPDLAGYNVLRSTVSGGPYDTIARGITATSFTDKGANRTIPYYYVLRAVDKSLNRSVQTAQVTATPTGANTLVAHLGLENNSNDSSGNGNHAETSGTIGYVQGRVGTAALSFNGTNTFVNMPPEVANFDRITLATWVYWNGGGAYQRIFDFGNDTSQYLFLTPTTGGGMRFAIKNGGAEQQLNAPALAAGGWHHVAVTLGDGTASLYVDGVSVAQSNAVSIKPSDFKPAINYLGKSQFADPLFKGTIDDFRIYNYALSASEIAALVSAAAEPSHSVAWWNFEEGVADGVVPYAPATAGQYDGSMLDISGNGNHLSAWADDWARYRANVPAAVTPAGNRPNTLSVQNENAFTAMSAIGTSLTTWNPVAWTIEAAIRPIDATNGFQTIVGRDSQGAFAGNAGLSALYFSVRPTGNLAVQFTDTAGNNWNLQSAANAVSDAKWHAVAATSDGDTLKLYLKNITDGAAAYSLLGTLDISSSINPSLSIGAGNGSSWDPGVITVGRGLFNGNHTDRFIGHIDDVRLSDVALLPDQFLYSLPPAAPTGLAAAATVANRIDLTWNASEGAARYNVKRAEISGGPFLTVATGVTALAFSDTGLPAGVTYYYVITAENNAGESVDSTQASKAALSPAQAWRLVHFLTSDNTGNAADNFDPDKDGVVNLLERAFGGNPNVSDANQLPSVDSSGPFFSITYRKAVAATDLTFTIQEASDFSSPWGTSSGSSQVVGGNETYQVIRFTAAEVALAKKFLRVQVTSP